MRIVAILLTLFVISAAPQTRTTIAFQRTNGVLVRAKVDGRGPFWFAVDTGSSVVILNRDLLRRLGSVATHAGGGQDGASGNAVASRDLTLKSVTVGGARAGAVAAAAIPLPLALTYLGVHQKASGLIGESYLQHYAVTFDFIHDTLALTRGPYAAHDAQRLGMTFVQGLPTITVLVDGVPARVIVDTGNVGEAMFTRAFAARLHLVQRSPTSFAVRSHGVGGSARETAIRVRSIQLAHAVVHNLAATISGALYPGVDGDIGLDVLNRFIVTMDYPHETAYFTPTPAVSVYRPYIAAGWHLARGADGTMTVTSVTAGTPAARAGFRAEDQLLTIGGRSVATMSSGELTMRLVHSAGKPIRCRVERNKRSVVLTLVPVDVLPVPSS